MGLFSKKPKPGDQAFSQYVDAMRPWMTRLQAAREAGTEIITVGDAVDAAGDVPALPVHGLTSYERDSAVSAASAWISMEADRMSRKDVLRGADMSFWQNMADELWSARDNGIKKQPR
ncbi:MAG TPA: hypothetical protein VE476_03220 [Propionibacteriaceae bacterium]|jgi:hypothetical protein|nr:hypothetical protein [Propionibacteriaceae bacterium]